MNLPWTTVKKNIIYQNKYGYTLRDDEVINPSGGSGKYMVLEGPEFVVIVALTKDNKVIMEKHWRYPIDQIETLEIPAGTVNPGENILDAAKRELLEETGCSSSDWQELNYFWLGNGVLKIKGHIFLAKNVCTTKPQNLEPTEKIECLEIPYSDLLKLIDEQKIVDERSLIGLLLVKDKI